MKKNVIKDSILYLPSKLFPALFGLMTAPIYTRLLTIKQFGQYQILLITLTIISSFFIGNRSVIFYFTDITGIDHINFTIFICCY